MKVYFAYRNAIDYASGLLTAMLFHIFVTQTDLGFRWPGDADKVALASAIMGVSASLLGLVLAASTFLVGHVQNDRFRMLREAQSWSEFPRLVKTCLWRLFILTIFSGIFLFAADEIFKIAAPALVFLVTIASLSVAALIWVITAIISIQDFK